MIKKFKLTLLLLMAFACTTFAQSKIPSTISIIDPQSDTEVPAVSDAANLFKTALVEVVTNTSTAKLAAVAKFGPGKRSIVITQADPQANGDAYQLILQRNFLGQNNIIYTFMYNVDQNKLWFFDENSQSWIEQAIKGDNVLNLNNCQQYGAFNQLNVQQPGPPDNGQQTAAVNTDVQPDTSVSVAAMPPALPDYDQPVCPTEGYLWQPGYWAYSLDSRGYYWVPGVWVAPPTVGLLWTPPYWGFFGGVYIFHAGYWGNDVGFYGGIDYGYGYGGVGFVGGEWRGGYFRYNTVIVRVGPGFHNVYEDRTVYHERGPDRYSFNGRGGYMARPTPHEMVAMHEQHVMATREQIRNQQVARADRTQFATNGGGRPGNLAAARAPEHGPVNNVARPAGTAGGRAPGPNRTGPPTGRPMVPGTRQAQPGRYQQQPSNRSRPADDRNRKN